MADTVQQIKAKLSILDVVGPYVKLAKSGKYFKGLSPFNKEKTPSFFVSPERGTYYCFSSGQGGDMFTFVEKMEGVDFSGALKILAEKAGVTITHERSTKKDTEKLARSREAVAFAELYFAQMLDTKGAAFAYARARGLTEASIAAWNLGYAPDAWRGLLDTLTGKGFTIPELVGAGLIKEADEKKGTYYDRFRNRLMFPIRDSAGRTVAFTGRALDPNDNAKYLNSPETELFKKSQVLFGMDKAKDAIRSRGFAILVEGQFDLTLLHQIGFANTIALSGTALSAEHLTLIKRYADNLMLVMDADRAGLSAAAKNAHAALSAGMRVKAVRLPLGKDPADLASETPQDMKRRIAESESIVEFFLSVLSVSERDPHRLVVSAERTVLPLIKAMRSPLEREHFIGLTARALALPPEAVREALGRVAEVITDDPPDPGAGAATSAPSPLEKRALFLKAAARAYPGTGLEKRVKTEYARIVDLSFTGQDTPPPSSEPSEEMLFAAGLAFGEEPAPDAADDLLRAFEQAVLTEALARASMQLRRAETEKNEVAIHEALTLCQELSARLATL